MTTTRTMAGALAAAVSLLSACGGDDPRPATWSYLASAVFRPSCATVSCHSESAAVAGLDFSDARRGYLSLTGLWVWIVDPTGASIAGCRREGKNVVCEREHRPLVVPYDPAQSRLVHMLRGRDAPRMPPDRPLARADIQLIEKWILSGATEGKPVPNESWTARDAAAEAPTADGGQPDQVDAADAEPPPGDGGPVDAAPVDGVGGGGADGGAASDASPKEARPTEGGVAG